MTARAQNPDEGLLDEALILLVRLHSGEPGAPGPGALDDWAARSPRHASAATAARALWSDTGTLRPMPGPEDAAGHRPSRRVLMLGGLGLLGAGGWAVHSRQRVPGAITTGTAQTRDIALSDGGRITLAPRSGIDLSAARGATLRAGQAWFDIRPGEGHFRLAAGGLRLDLDHGALDLDLRAGDGSAVLALGDSPARLPDQPGQRLDPGHIYRLTPDRAPRLLPGRAEDAFAWRQGRLVAEDIPLGDIIATLNDWHPGWIRIADRGLADLRVTAVLDLRRPEAALRSLQHGLPIRLRSLGGVILSLERA